MPLKDEIGKCINPAERFLEAAPAVALCPVVAAASMAAGDWPLSLPDKTHAH